MTLDPTIAAMCAAAWIELLALWCAAVLHGATLPDALAWMLERDRLTAEATSCGYISTRASRRAARHGGFASGVVRPPVRETADGRARAEAVAWGLSR